MGVNTSHENKPQMIESEFNKLNISDNNCSYCNKQFTKELWCKDCDPFRIIEGWTSGNPDIDQFIKDTIYNARHKEFPKFLEWVPFDEFTYIKQVGEGGFAKVYTAAWVVGKSKFKKQNDGTWKKLDRNPMKVALKRLNGSQNISADYLNEVYLHYIYIIFILFYYLILLIIKDFLF